MLLATSNNALRSRARLADPASLRGTHPTDVALDPIEFRDAHEGFAGNRRRAGRGQLVKAPPHIMAWMPPLASS